MTGNWNTRARKNPVKALDNTLEKAWSSDWKERKVFSIKVA